MGRPSKASTIKSKDTLDPYGFEFPEESDAKGSFLSEYDQVKARRVSSMSLKPGKDKGQKTRTTTTTTTRASVPWSAKAKQPQHPTLAAVNLNKLNSVKASDSHVQMRELEFDDDEDGGGFDSLIDSSLTASPKELPDLPPPTTYATHLNQAEHSRGKKVEKSKPVMPSTKPLPAHKTGQPILTSTSAKQSAAISKPIVSRQNPFFIDDDVSEEEEEEKVAVPKKRVSAQSKLKHSQEDIYHFSDEDDNKIDEGQAKIQKKDATAHAKSMRDSKHRVPVPLSPSPPPLSVLSQDSKVADDDSDDADKTFVVDDQSEYGMFGNDDGLVDVVGSKKMSTTKRSNVMQIDGGLEYEEIDVEKEVSDDGDMEYEEAPKKGRGKSRGEVAVGKTTRGRKNTKRKRGGNDEEGDDDGEGVETSFKSGKKSRESSGGPSQYELELTEMIQAADGILETVIAERFNALQTLATKNEGDFEDQKSCASKVRRQETTMCKKFHESIESLESSISEKKAMFASFHKEAEATFRANKTQAMGLIEKMNGRVQSIVGQTKVMVEREYDTSRVKEQLAALMGSA
ncbi:hypothetical protein HDU79_008463 [Rhizoclosmatium sp. JEL0117]|nr:hypothetical protein HDU79_008463 [Rhizoclosmatium sp. JEL0117]